MKVQTQQQQQQQRGGYSTNEFNNYFKLLTQMETQHQIKLNNLRKQINQFKAEKVRLKHNNLFIVHINFFYYFHQLHTRCSITSSLLS